MMSAATGISNPLPPGIVRVRCCNWRQGRWRDVDQVLVAAEAVGCDFDDVGCRERVG